MTRDAGASFALQACRACQSETRTFLDLGQSPIANRLLCSPSEPAERYRLGLSRCTNCDLVQNSTCLSSDLLFDDGYGYLSSVSSSVQDNARDLAERVTRHLSGNTLVLDVGSNDGTLQNAFRSLGIECYGVDPSPLPVAQARKDGLTSFCRVFDAGTAASLLSEYGKFSAITMSNVLAHVADPLAMLRAARSLLDDNSGLLVIEVQSWRDLVRLGAFDMVYHEHHSHFSLNSALALLEAASLFVFEVQETKAQGGSLRLWCRLTGQHAPAVTELARQEEETLANDEADLNAALERCRLSANAFQDQTQGRNVAGYGAAAKTVTLLAALGSDLAIHCVADKAPTKTGKFLPSHAIPIVTPQQMLDTGAEVILLFAWNLTGEILPQLQGRETWVPFPEFRRIQ